MKTLYHYYGTVRKGDRQRHVDGTFELERPMDCHEDYETAKAEILRCGEEDLSDWKLSLESVSIISENDKVNHG